MSRPEPPLPGVAIRPSSPEDAERFRRCLDAVARERRHLAMVEAPPLERVRAFLGSLAEAGVVQRLAVADGDVVGWCDVIPNPVEGFRHSAALGMGLLPPWRGRGLGTALLREVLDEAEERGLRRIELEVYTANGPAIALYERFGFEREGVKRAARVLDGRSEDILCMARLLPARRSAE